MINYKIKEKATHGDDLFPIRAYFNDGRMTYLILDCHWHDEVEFIYMRKGKATFFVNTIPIKVSENEVLLINSKDIHMAYALNDSHCIYESIVFKLDMLSSSILDVCQNDYIYPLLSGTYKFPLLIEGENDWERAVIDNILCVIKQLGEKHSAYELSVKASLYQIIALLFSNNAIIKSKSGLTENNIVNTERIRRTLSYMSIHYSDDITIDDLCTEINLSKFYFCRLFKELTGRSPLDYLNYYRINKAGLFLEDKGLKISEAASSVGFDNFSYFVKMFKHYKGVTPSEFRKL